MKLFAAAAAALLVTTGAYAADLPTKKEPIVAPVAFSPWDFEVGAQVTTDYLFRGLTQSNHAPSVWAHGEIRYNINDMFQLYAGVAGESIKLSNVVPSPSMELDGYGGLRVTYGNFGLDLGGIYYGYPNTPTGIVGVTTPNPVFSPKPISWFELYAKPSYTVTDWLSIGANFFYTPSYLNTGAHGEYLSATAKVTLPYGFAVSGELGHQWLGTTDFIWFNPAAPFLAANLGFTPGEYIRSTRIEHAKSLLSETDNKVESIALLCGYRSVNSFFIAFKQACGTPPGEFRKHATRGRSKSGGGL